MNVKEKVEINGEILKQAREEKGYKQDDLAKAIFSTRQSISNWENGKKTPTLENVKRLAEILEIPVNELIANSEENESFLNTEEELSDNNIIDYTLVYDKTSESRFKKLNLKKIIKIVVLIILLIFLIYLCSSIRKFVILNNINNKRNTYYEKLNNYFYTITTYEYDNDVLINYYNEDGYYNNNKLKSETSTIKEKEYIDYFLENVHYKIDLKKNTYTVTEIGENNNNRIKAVNININKIILNSMKLNFKVIDSDYYYYLFYKENIQGKIYNIEEKINKKTGMIVQKELKYDNSNVINKYYVEINSAKDSDFELINLENFIKE